MIEIPSPKITKLDLSNKGLTTIPQEVYDLKNLKKLNLSGNKLKVITKEANRLKKLEMLDVSNNKIVNLYSKNFEFRRLRILNLNNNNISSIPLQIGKLQNLEIFQVANNSVKELPFAFSNLINLRELNLSRNPITKFPFELLNITNLRKLWINDLELKEFPIEEIKASLNQLVGLYCFSKNISKSNVSDSYYSLVEKKGNCISYLNNNFNSQESLNIPNQIQVNTMKDNKVKKNKIFISYSHKDIKWLKEVKQHLKALSFIEDDFEVWDDTELRAGNIWREEIKEALDRSGIAILLISTNFLASDFIRNNELPTILENAKEKGTKLLSLNVKSSLYEFERELPDFQAINSPDRPLYKLSEPEQDEELIKLSKEVRRIISGDK